MKVFAWNSRRETDTVMTPLDSIKYNHQMMQTAFMAMDPMSGAVKAWIGGIDFKTYKFDHANLNTKRQVGSSIKPLLYSDAIENAGFTPETPCENTAQYFDGYGMVPAKGCVREMANSKYGKRTGLFLKLCFSIYNEAGYAKTVCRFSEKNQYQIQPAAISIHLSRRC